ncbi:MAG: hypothetical protein HQL30_09200 [Candidatus Omnitrophica bacterium]|nr:hypothetical protein [Candidatus Omnitrophota bacterium]
MKNSNDESFAMSGAVVCDKCGRDHPVDLWAIIDAEARPDLLAKMAVNTLNVVTCPHCEGRGHIGGPLFVIFPKVEPPKPFTRTVGVECGKDKYWMTDEDAVNALFGALVDERGEEWVDKHLSPPFSMTRPDVLIKTLLDAWKPVASPDNGAEKLRQSASDRIAGMKARSANNALDPFYTDTFTGYNMAAWSEHGYALALKLVELSPSRGDETARNYADRIIGHLKAIKKEYSDDPADQDGGGAGAFQSAIMAVDELAGK